MYEKLAPEKPYSQYNHNGFGDNADAHLKRTVMGREVVVAVTKRQLVLAPGSKFFTLNLMASATSGCSSKLLTSSFAGCSIFLNLQLLYLCHGMLVLGQQRANDAV